MCMAVIRRKRRQGEYPPCCCTAAAPPVPAPRWSGCRSIFRSRSFIIIRILPRRESSKSAWRSSGRLIAHQPAVHPVQLIAGDYEPAAFAAVAKGYEDCPEGGARCMRCYRQRLEKTAALAKEMGFDYFCTTLSISPLKDAQKINAIGQSVGEQYGVAWLPSDFKKQERYKRSIALSREYGLYRQNFCGCVYSKQEKEKPV